MFAAIFFCAMCCPALLSAAETAATNTVPRIDFSETVFDFGRVTSSGLLRHDFVVTNMGNAVLEILDVKGGCGCTTAGAWDKLIEPGKTGKIPIQFNPANFSDPVTKPVTVICNVPAKNIQSLQIKADIWKPIDIQPSHVQFLPVEGEATNETRVVRITNRSEVPLTLEPQPLVNSAFRSELKTIRAGQEFELHVSYSGMSSNSATPTQISFKTSITNLPVITVTAYAMPQPAVAISPTQITLPARQTDAAYKQSALVRNNSTTPLQVTEATVNAEGVTVKINETISGKIFSLTIDYPPNFHPSAGTPLQLTVKTSHPKRPLLTVPILVAASQTPVAPPVPALKTGAK